MLEIVCLYHRATSTAIGVRAAFRVKMLRHSRLLLQRFYHDTQHCIGSKGRDDDK